MNEKELKNGRPSVFLIINKRLQVLHNCFHFFLLTVIMCIMDSNKQACKQVLIRQFLHQICIFVKILHQTIPQKRLDSCQAGMLTRTWSADLGRLRKIHKMSPEIIILPMLLNMCLIKLILQQANMCHLTNFCSCNLFLYYYCYYYLYSFNHYM